MRVLIYGGLAGVAATAAMTFTMRALHTRLPQQEKYELPPREILDQISGAFPDEENFGAAREPGRPEVLANSNWSAEDEKRRAFETVTAHFLYGAAAGALFACQRSRSAASGAGYGLAVWTGSYLGWLPAAGILTSATQHPAKRNMLMLSAHLIWGTALSKSLEQIEKSELDIFASRAAQQYD